MEFTFDFTPMLRTREKIQATVNFLTDGRGFDFHFALFTPRVSVEPAKAEIRQRLFAEADAIVNRWGLQFPSADAALDLSAYQSLTAILSAIASPEFIVRRVVVRQIVPLTERVASVQAPASTKPSREEQMVGELREDVAVINALLKFKTEDRKEHPELWEDELYGSRLERKVETRINQFLPFRDRL